MRDYVAPVKTIRFRNDKKMRDKLYVAEAYAHPAKGNLYMWLEMIERYSSPGDTILDPMGGIGTTLIAALLGRNVCLVELEQHFVDPMRASWEKMRQHPMLGYEMGEVLILRGDARALPIASADAILTSPPYAGSVEKHNHGMNTCFEGEQFGGPNSMARRRGYTRPAAIITSPPYGEALAHGGGGANADKGLGDGYTRPAAIITSPPYEGSIQGEPGIDWTKMDGGKRDMTQESAQAVRVASLSGYTRPDCIVTSPPYDNRLADKYDDGDKGRMQYFLAGAEAAHNVGNERGEQYWRSMSQIYQECFRVLRPGGLMALVLGNYVRDGKIVDLVGQTIVECEQLGFEVVDHWQRIKWSLSFWRILQAKKGGPVIDREDVVAFRKPSPGSGLEGFLMEKVRSPSGMFPTVQFDYTSVKSIKDPSPQLPLSFPAKE